MEYDLDAKKCRKILQKEFAISTCPDKLIQMEQDEFIVLENQTIYVNATRKFYNTSQYVWYNDSLFICDIFPKLRMPFAKVSNDKVLVILTLSCMLVSIVSLLFVLLTYSLFRELRTIPGVNLMNLSVSILLGQCFWAFGSRQIGRQNCWKSAGAAQRFLGTSVTATIT